MSYEYQTTISVPVVIQGVPEGKAVKSPFPRRVQLRFRGEGWQLATLLLGSDTKLVLDANVRSAAVRVLTLNDVPEKVNLPAGVQPVAMKPESLFIALDSYSEKKVPVLADYEITLREGYGQIGPTIVIPESVVIGGATSVLKRIMGWRTARVVFENLRGPINTNVPLADTMTYMLVFDPPDVNFRINVQQFAEKLFSGLPIEVSSMPPDREVIFSPPRVDIVVRGGIDQLSGLSSTDFQASLDYNEILSDTSGMLEVGISAPDGVQVVSQRPQRHQYVVRKKIFAE
ncbi:MAG: hypothetical protein HY708_01215 [Ignavibacteriae bacterium]|nr:hypothetical protein [Ignavibacteriota bacterium]